MKGIIYTRVSSEEQVKGTSLEFQEELCRKYCAQKGIEVVAVFREEGESAKSLSLHNRKKFLEALDFCRKKKNQIQAFVVLRIDRFARNTEDHFAIRKILSKYDTTLHSVTEPIGNKPAEKFIETVLSGAAEYENALRKQRCSDGMISKINQGIFPWKPPLGYKCLHFKKKGEKKTEPDPPDEQIFPLIQKALKEYAKGSYSLAELARILDKWGLKTILGKRTKKQTINRMLGKYLKFYAGIIVNPWTGDEIEGLHKPMITKEEMYQIQLVRSGRTKKLSKYNKQNPDFPLRRIVLCGNCNRPLTGSVSRGNGGRYFYYHCAHHDCQMYGKTIPKQNLEAEFSKYLGNITPKERFFKVFKETVLDLCREKRKALTTAKLKYERQLSKLQEKRKRIFEMREEGSYTKEEFLERKKNVEEEILELNLSLKESDFENIDIENVLTYAIEFIGDLGKEWYYLPPHLLPRFQKLVFPEGIPYYKNSGFGTTKLGVIFNLNQAFLRDKSLQRSHEVDLRGLSWNQIIKELMKWYHLKEGFLPLDSQDMFSEKQ
jgi:DNA invertase Pin-like site-specific DNA recombinase